jgi:hypothetical protein
MSQERKTAVDRAFKHNLSRDDAGSAISRADVKIKGSKKNEVVY